MAAACQCLPSVANLTLPRMSYVERDGIWHIVPRIEDAEAVTVCNLRIVQQTYLWEREPSPVCSRCKAG